MMKEKQKTNWVLTIVLILGTVTVFFPLYMAVIIAFKKPSEMINDVEGALSFPKQWSFENFRQAMEVTDFWHSLGNSLLITLVTILLAILIHSIAGYVIGRGMARKKSFRFIYLYIVSGMFVPFSILMMLYWSSFLVTLCSEIMLYIETPLVSYSYSLNEVSHSCTS